MFEDEEIPTKKASRLSRPPLDPLSVADLQTYIAELREEIGRAEAAITHKQGARGAADGFFKF